MVHPGACMNHPRALIVLSIDGRAASAFSHIVPHRFSIRLTATKLRAQVRACLPAQSCPDREVCACEVFCKGSPHSHVLSRTLYEWT